MYICNWMENIFIVLMQCQVLSITLAEKPIQLSEGEYSEQLDG